MRIIGNNDSISLLSMQRSRRRKDRQRRGGRNERTRDGRLDGQEVGYRQTEAKG
jgi:hypothetical protein